VALLRQLEKLEENASDFTAAFDSWKASGVAGEFDSYLFGKDGAYLKPAVFGAPDALRHVHIVPLSDADAHDTWNQQWRRRSRKVSDRALVYAQDPAHGHLLIWILRDPGAHAVARMETEADRTLMLKLLRIAERFVHDGEVIG